METSSYKSVLQMAESLSHDDQLRLIRDLIGYDPFYLMWGLNRDDQSCRIIRELLQRVAASSTQHSIMELSGLGAEIWNGIDAQEYVDQERSSWAG
jgi:hypothetical protein